MATSSPTPNPERRGLVAALVIATLLVVVGWRAEHATVGSWGFPLDDAWIHNTIARNLVHGHGWSYNPGVPVQNSSGPLWTALVALGYLLAGPGVWAPKILGAACFLGCVAMAWRLARTLSGDAWAAAGAGLAAALSGSLLWHGLSGMETALAALLTAASLDAFVGRRAGRGRFAWAALVALGTMARPEVLVLLPILAGVRWWEMRGTPQRGREVIIAVGVAIAALLPYFALNFARSGSLFPSTFAAKAADTGVVRALGHGDLPEVLVSLTLAPFVWLVHGLAFWAKSNLALLLGAAVGCLAACRGSRRALAPALVLGLFPALRGAMAPHWNPIIQQGRYLGALMPTYFALAAVGLATLVRAWPAASSKDERSARSLARRVTAICLGLAVLAFVLLEARLPHVGPSAWSTLPALVSGTLPDPGLDAYLQWERFGLVMAVLVAALLLGLTWVPRRGLRAAGVALGALAVLVQVMGAVRIPRFYARNVRNIQDMDVALGNWVRGNVPPGTRIAVNDIGALAYFGERPVVDAMGLASPELAPYLSPLRLRTLVGMRRLHPEICILFPSWFPEWTSRPSLLTPILRQTVTDNTVLGSGVAVVYHADWERFARYYDDALLERLDPPLGGPSLGLRWNRTLQNLGMPTRAKLYQKAGELWLQRGDAAAAEGAFRAAVHADPRQTEAWLALLQLYGGQRDATRYGSTLQEMVQSVPNSPAAYEAMGDFQAAAGRSTEAAASYERALALHPDNLRLLGKLESYASTQGDAARAATYRARLADLQNSPGAPAGAR